MSTTTTRNSLVKPGYADAADIAVINTNYDIIDNSFAKCNWAGGAAPTVNDDFATDGYSIGSLWYDTTNHKLYIAETVGTGTATWREIYSTATAISGYVKADGTVPLTANWDVGAYKVTANQLESDVVTGTAPILVNSTTNVPNLNCSSLVGHVPSDFLHADGSVNATGTINSTLITGTAPITVTSTTKCTNLNADTLDGIEAAAFPLLAGLAGGQTLNGGTDASENLTLSSTANATKGAVIVPASKVNIGTKATTNDACIQMHENAAGASCPINFLDGDGSTVRAAIWKPSGDSLALAAGDGVTAGLTVSTAGVVSATRGLAASTTLTDPGNGANTLALTTRTTYTGAESVAETYYGIYNAIFPEVQAGHTNSGNMYAYYNECMRNHNAAGTDDDGTLSALYANQCFFGHYSANTSMAGTTTYADGIRIVPYYTHGTISNLYCFEISTGGTGGTVTANWGIYDNHAGNNYYGATYNRFQTTSGDRVIYVVQTSATDPIADAWNTHSNSKYKNKVDDLDVKAKRKSVKDEFKSTPLHKWKRKMELDDPAHYEAMFPLEDDRPRGRRGEIPAKALDVRQAEQDYSIYKHIDSLKTNKKFTKEQYGMFAEEAPECIQTHNHKTGEVEGIDLGAYCGWLHAVNLAQEDEIDDLKAKLDGMYEAHADAERRMAALEKRLAKLEK